MVRGSFEDRGQIHTLEGFTAAFIVLFALLFTMQAISITPTSSSTASQEVEQHNYKMAGDILDASKANGDLRRAILNWDNESQEFSGSVPGVVYYGGISNRTPGGFGDALDILREQGIAYNVEVVCRDNSVSLARNGEPSLNAVTARTSVQLFDHNELSGGTELGEVEEILGGCENVNEDSELYNVVEVRLVAWRQ